MSYSPILIVAGEPNSIFLEIFFKVISKNKIKSPIILITSKKLLTMQMKVLNFHKKIKILNPLKLNKYKLNNRTINLIDIKYSQKKAFEKISKKSNLFIKKSFDIAFKIIKLGVTNKLINGPISKKYFLSKKFLGITEYLEKKSNSEGSAMLIYNPKLSVCPVTTHLPIKFVAKEISKKNITKKIFLINSFYKNNFNKTPRIAILGLNPHCESIDKFNEDEKILKPTIK